MTDQYNPANEEFDDMDDFDDDMEELLESIELTLPTGETKTFLISDYVEVDGDSFIVVFDMEDESDECEAFIFKQVGEDGDEVVYDEVTEEEFFKVAEALKEQSDEYEIGE